MTNVVFLLWSLLLSTCCATFKFYDGLVNSRVQSATYLSSAVTKLLITVEVKNVGSESADKYLLSLPKSLDDNLAFIEVFDSDKNRLPFDLESTVDGVDNSAAAQSVFYSIDLPATLKADNGASTQQLKLTVAYTHQLTPLPAQIKKGSKQFVVYEALKYFYSPYKTEKLGTKYSFPSDKLKSYPKTGADMDGKRITYGPFKDVEPFNRAETVRFHFQFHAPTLTMSEVVRDIEISHWGNVRFEESFLLHHDGATLKGPYEVGMYDRMDHVMGAMASNSDPASVRTFRATLPPGASNVFYIDRIGNVSTSNFREGTMSRDAKKSKNSVLEMRPRYPLYGGWKTDFVIGYDVPSSELISIDGISRVHTLNISFGIPFQEPVTDVLVTRIALPEGAHDVKVICPYDIVMEAESKRFTYLDSFIGGGRPLITFSKRNVINLHSEFFQITYIYDTTRIYYKPASIILAIFGFFASAMILSRVSPSLSSENDQDMSRDADSGAPDEDDKAERQSIEQLMKLKCGGNDSVAKIVKRLEQISNKTRDSGNKRKVDNAVREIKQVQQQLNARGNKNKKNSDDTEAKASVNNILKGLRQNL